MPTFRRVPSRPKVADLRQEKPAANDASVEVEGAAQGEPASPAANDAEVQPAGGSEESYRDLQNRAKEAGVSPLNVSREELLDALGEGL